MEIHFGPVHVRISTSSKSIEIKIQKKCLHEAALQVSGVFQGFVGSTLRLQSLVWPEDLH